MIEAALSKSSLSWVCRRRTSSSSRQISLFGLICLPVGFGAVSAIAGIPVDSRCAPPVVQAIIQFLAVLRGARISTSDENLIVRPVSAVLSSNLSRSRLQSRYGRLILISVAALIGAMPAGPGKIEKIAVHKAGETQIAMQKAATLRRG